MFDRMCKIIRSIRDEHLSAVHSLVKSAEIRRQTSKQIEDDCQGLLDYICIFRFNPFDINSRSKDSLLSVGEILSCRVITAMLLDRNVDAVFVSLCSAVPAGDLHRLQPGWFEEAAEAIGEKLQLHHGKVIVVTGFFGAVPGSLIDSSIGRGYSDVCAALVGIGLQAKRINIWKEVDGIFTADPREVADARCLSTITSSEVAALTFYGSEVVHHLALTLATKACPPIQMSVRNIQKPSASGTLIIPNPAKPTSKQLIAHLGSGENGGHLAVQPPLITGHVSPTGITVKRDVAVIEITGNGNSLACDFFANIFAILASHDVAADLVCITESQISMAINTVGMSAERMEDFQLELEREGAVSIGFNRAILSLVGPTSKATTAIAGQMFSALGKQNILVEMISKGLYTHPVSLKKKLLNSLLSRTRPDEPLLRGPCQCSLSGYEDSPQQLLQFTVEAAFGWDKMYNYSWLILHLAQCWNFILG